MTVSLETYLGNNLYWKHKKLLKIKSGPDNQGRKTEIGNIKLRMLSVE